MMGRHVRSVVPDQPRMRRVRLVARGLANPKGTLRSLSTQSEVAVIASRDQRCLVGAALTLAPDDDRESGPAFARCSQWTTTERVDGRLLEQTR
jgi:hypothetical protein